MKNLVGGCTAVQKLYNVILKNVILIFILYIIEKKRVCAYAASRNNGK